MRKLLTTSLLLAGGALFFVSAQPAAATEYPWCAQYTGSSAGMNCGFVSQRQCLATVSGVGGFCRANPWFLDDESYRFAR
jgi:hypothetical protein